MKCLRDPALPLHQFREIISALPGRIPQNLYEQVQAIAQGYASVLDALRFYCEGQDGFLATEMHEAVERCLLELKPQDRAQLNATLATAGLPRFLQAFKDGNHTYAVQVISELLMDYHNDEEHFSHAGIAPENIIKRLRKVCKDDLSLVSRVARAHFQLETRSALVQ